MKIAILLPYKENFSSKNAGAVSLFVSDINKTSIFKKNIVVFGSTKSKNYLSNNYINIDVDNSFFKSSNKTYIDNFLKKKVNSYDVIEVHNRPSYIKQIKSKFLNNIFLYFHNDPTTMNGSKSIQERKYLIENVDKIFFNSKWSRDRFFFGFQNKEVLLDKTCICYQSTNKVNINFKNKKKIISFVGKLNSSKGYDIFGKTVLKILDKHKTWKSIVIGDEPREKMFFKHKNLSIKGFKNNIYVLNELKKVSISIVCSRWDEPFGRTSLEAASRGCAVIISNKGGLPETSKSAIILKKLDEKNLFREIDKLILNKKLLLNKQKNNYNNFFLTHEYIAGIIDKERKHYEPKKLNINKNKILKIMHITNFNYRFNGRLHYNTGRRLNNGFVRLGHNVLTISDRDVINQNKNIRDLTGKKSLQNNIIKSYYNFYPDLIVFGHADSVSKSTLDFFKRKNVKMCQWFLDPISRHGPDYNNNKQRLIEKNTYVDATFLTTDPESVSFKLNNSYFIPNPCDASFETLDNFKFDNEFDLFFAMSHGVHRGQLKKGKFDNRETFIKKLINKNDQIKFDIYGMNNVQPIWANEFIKRISKSNMALNLSRGKPIKCYTSDRIAQLMGNGLLTFIDKQTHLMDFFSNHEAIFYKNMEDLYEKILKYKRDNKDRKKIAKKGKDFYFRYFNSTLVADFIIQKTLDYNNKKNFIWQK